MRLLYRLLLSSLLLCSFCLPSITLAAGHKQMLGVFVGATGNVRRSKNPTFAFEYEYMIEKSWGMGVTLEHAAGDMDFNILAIPVAYHYQYWKFVVAPGIERSDDHGSEMLLRFGAEYVFKFEGNWEIAPKANIDFVDGHQVLVIGAVFAKLF